MASKVYLSAALDTVAMADLVVMVVTPESYSDKASMELRAIILQSGVQCRAVVNRVPSRSAGEERELLEDIRKNLGGHRIEELRPFPAVHLSKLPMFCTLTRTSALLGCFGAPKPGTCAAMWQTTLRKEPS